MYLKRVSVLFKRDAMNTSTLSLYVHELPIMESVYGEGKLTEYHSEVFAEGLERDADGAVIDMDAKVEFERLVSAHGRVKFGEDLVSPVFSVYRTALDLEREFAIHTLPEEELTPTVDAVQPGAPVSVITSTIGSLRKQLDVLGVEYHVNAGIPRLTELLQSAQDADDTGAGN